MAEINKEAMYKQLNTQQPQLEAAIAQYMTTPDIRQNLLHFINWLHTNGATIKYADYEGQSPFWEIELNGKSFYMVLNGVDNVCIMLKMSFSPENQAIMRKNNMQDTILNNLQYCTRKDGGHCGNCHLPHDVTGQEVEIFDKTIQNLCCGQFISFDNPDSATIEGIQQLINL
ncbi:MAG: hypothetical protein FWG38_09870 [Defluviitaleaceae bacterium]|nr:hypothetical protein [Defluviitaleaceae bacterium]